MRVVLAVLAVHAGLLAWSAYRHSPTIDEPAHLAAGISHWQYGRFDLYSVNPPLVRMIAALPVMLADPVLDWGAFRPADRARAEFNVGDAFSDANGERIFWLTTLARWACIPFSLLGGWFCFRWAQELFGEPCGLLALVLWCFSPNVLGHAALITADVPAAATGVMAAYSFWMWLKDGRLGSALVAGVALGVALLVKSTLILFCGLWPLVWLLYRWSSRQPWEWRSVGRELGQGTLLIVIAMTILNVGYGLEGSFRPLGEYEFRSRMLTGSADSTTSVARGNRFRGTVLAACPVPLPANYLLGIDHQREDFEDDRRRYFRGEVRSGEEGWWYFYLYAAAVKVPLGTWLLALLALPIALRGRLADQLVLLTPAVTILVLVSSQTGLNFFRYLLPAFPFVFVWISQAARHLSAAQLAPRLLCVAGTGWMIASSLWVYPHSLSYFNELVGGPKNGYRIMVDSNTDWGQDLLYLKEWIEEHPSAAGLRLNYYGVVKPELAGLDVSDVETLLEQQTGRTRVSAFDEGDPQWYAISVTKLALQAAARSLPDGEAPSGSQWCEYLFDQQPDARAGYSIHIYRLKRGP